jgi:hypothetical protein
MPPRQLKLHRHPASKPSARPPLLFVHGAYTNATGCFIPYFNARG